MAKRKTLLEYLPIFGKARKDDPEYVPPKVQAQEQGEGFTGWQLMDQSNQSMMNSYNAYVNIRFKEDRERIREYRKMAGYSEVSDVIESIADEATMKFPDNNVIQLSFRGNKFEPENGKLPAKKENQKKRIQEEFDNLFFDTLDINKKAWDWFLQFLVDGRLYQEVVINEKNPKLGVRSLKILPSETMIVIYNPKTGEPYAYQQQPVPPVTTDSKMSTATVAPGGAAHPVSKGIPFDPDQISFIYYAKDPNEPTRVLGYLDKAIKPYRQLRLLEDSVVIYRIVRAPERLVFTIDVGGMPKAKAMEFIKRLQRDFSKKMTYDTNDAVLRETPNVISALENFWLPRNSDGRGPSVEVLQGGDNLGEIRDLDYFLKKLYKSLKYPLGRSEQPGGAQGGQVFFQTATEVTKDELKFAKFIERLQRKFENSFKDIFMRHLNFMGLKKEFDLSEHDICIDFKVPSNYKELVSLGEDQKRAESYLMLATQEEFSKEWLMKRYMRLTDEEIEQNRELLEKEREEAEEGEGFRGGPESNQEPPEPPEPPEPAEPKEPEPPKEPEEEPAEEGLLIEEE